MASPFFNKNWDLSFRFCAEGAMPSPGEKVAERSEVGCGMREATQYTV